MSDDVTLDTRGLDQLIKSLKGKIPQGKIGVLGSATHRDKDEDTNATIGMKHEFGDPSAKPPLPQRSFLRMPLQNQMQKYLDKAKAFDEDVLKDVIKTGTVTPWLRLVMYEAEQIVFDAFNSGGFGQWRPSVMEYKKNHQTLVETQQLRNSILSQVEE